MPKKAKSSRGNPDNGSEGKSGRGHTQFPGILADAKALGVTRIHLWRVLTGRRESARLLIRYKYLKQQQATPQQNGGGHGLPTGPEGGR